MQLLITSDVAVPIRRKRGITISFINQSAVDVYLDDEAMRLNQTAPGVVPFGQKVANGGGQLQISNFKGLIWARAVSPTTIEVNP